MPRTHPATSVAIPAHNEADRIEACLAALTAQRDLCGAPLPADTFEVVIFANNCGDATTAIAEDAARASPIRLVVITETLAPARSNAGGARRRAMDIAAARLDQGGHADGLIMTTDADSLVASTWIAASLRAFAEGADAVAGYVDAHPLEMMRLGLDFVSRGRLEETYQRMLAEIDALCDPRPHDPWPNHRVTAGASLAVTLRAYRAIGGLPEHVVGEDAALAEALDRAGFKVRHSMDVVVSTSCRLDGRVRHGAAETMRHRQSFPDAPCDGDLEPAFSALRRALIKGRIRRLVADRLEGHQRSISAFGLSSSESEAALAASQSGTFQDVWAAVRAASPRLQRGEPLRPSDLPGQIRRAERVLRALRRAEPQDRVKRSRR